jgi:hypothetical protein
MRTLRTQRSHRRALLPFLLAGALSLGAGAVAGLQPSSDDPIADSAFVPVTLNIVRPIDRADRAGGGPMQAHRTPTIADPWLLVTPPTDRARPTLPASSPIVVVRPQPTATAATSSKSSSHSISGRASWYCDAGVSACTSNHPDTSGFDAYAAAGPRLRAAIGSGWRGMVVTVDGLRVKLIDWCQCYQGQSNEKLLDLYHDVYLRTGSAVTIRW